MANLSNYWASKLADYNFGNTTFTMPLNWYIAISTTEPQKDGTGVTEPTDPAYARLAIANNKVSFDAAANGVITNLVQFQYNESTINQGVVTHWAIYDAASGGNMCYFGALTNTRTVEIATTLVLPVGELEITFL